MTAPVGTPIPELPARFTRDGLHAPRPLRARPDRGWDGPSCGPRPLRPAGVRPGEARPADVRPAEVRRDQSRRQAVVHRGPGPADLGSARAAHLILAVVVTVALVCGLGAVGHLAGDGSDVPSPTAVVQVGAGETLWDVAERVAPGSERQAVVQRIRELNGMAGSELRPGQALRVPHGP